MKLLTSLIVVFAIIAAGYFAFQKFIVPSYSSIAPTVAPYPVGDINKSGSVDEADRQMVRDQLNCKKSDPCWDKVIGKTHDGDNPIYTYDLDRNQDGVIDNNDLPQ